MNFYTYVVRFVDGHYYYGYHPTYGNDPRFDNYFGTPVTHREKWLTTMYWKEILGLYETFQEADEAERSLIRPQYKTDPLCLNENCGGAVSPDLCRVGGNKGGQTNKESGQAYEWGKKYGRIAAESGQLAAAREKINWETYAERTREAKRKNGLRAVESGQFEEVQRKGVEATKIRHSVKSEEGKSILAKDMALKSHAVKNAEGKSINAINNGRKGGLLPWWHNPATGKRKRQHTSPGMGRKKGSGPKPW
jgi:hypothetical protein